VPRWLWVKLKVVSKWGIKISLLGREVDIITDGGLLPFARESAERDKKLIYERKN
jgi:hypothetical protein